MMWNISQRNFQLLGIQRLLWIGVLMIVFTFPTVIIASEINVNLFLTYQGTQHKVTGTVTSADNGQPLPGVNITVKDTSIGTLTNAAGEYTLQVPVENDRLMFLFIGFQTKEIAIGGCTVDNVQIGSQSIAGREFVFVGYGTQQQQDVTGSVSTVSSVEVTKVPVSDPASALKGRAAGVLVTGSGGRPGDDVTVCIRGRRSLTASNDPLYVVDGIPFSGDLSAISPQHIKSMEVLKDASAQAIYGSRGANGVILITTKRGGNFDTRVSYSGYLGISRQLEEPDMMTGPEFAEMRREGFRATNSYSNDENIFTTPELQAIQ